MGSRGLTARCPLGCSPTKERGGSPLLGTPCTISGSWQASGVQGFPQRGLASAGPASRPEHARCPGDVMSRRREPARPGLPAAFWTKPAPCGLTESFRDPSRWRCDPHRSRRREPRSGGLSAGGRGGRGCSPAAQGSAPLSRCQDNGEKTNHHCGQRLAQVSAPQV